MERNDTNYETKLAILNGIDQYFLFSRFSVEKATENLSLRQRFYEVAIHVVSYCEIPSQNFKYVVSNFSSKHNPSDTDGLLTILEELKNNPKRNDSIFILGFRSISFILKINFQELDISFFRSVERMLSPFYLFYSHK